MTDRDSFVALMGRLRSGEDDAAREVFLRFARRLVALARRRFDQQLANRVDPEDVVQSAFKSFFVRHREGGYHLDDWDGLWSLLALITLRKCLDRVEYHRAERRDIAREVSAPGDEAPPWHAALDREPLPEEAAILAESVEHLFRTSDADDRPILELSLQGYSAAEIGLKLGRALRSVQRTRERLRRRLEQDAAAGPIEAG